MTVKEIYNFLNSLFPVSTACDFDNSGLLIGDPEAEINNTLISLDCTLETVKNAIKNNCQLIITHHPVIFSPIKNAVSGSVVYELIRNNIAVISMHTNLDIADGGVTDSLCKAIGIEEIQPVTASDGFLLRGGVISPVNAENFAKSLKTALGSNIRYVDGGKSIEKVLVCSGSGGEFVADAIFGGYDALVTSEIKHHQFLMAQDNQISAFDAGHFATEVIVIKPLMELLQKQFPRFSFLTDTESTIKYI